MWSKTRKKLLENLPDKLKGKIDFQMAGYRKSNCFNHESITILYNKKIVLRTSDWPEETTFFETWKFESQFKKYMQFKNYITAKDKNNEYFRVFALLDKRTGKRTLEKYRDENDFLNCVIEDNFELENIYRIRFEVENIKIDEDGIALLKFINEEL